MTNIFKQNSFAKYITLSLIKNIFLALIITIVFGFATGYKYLNILTGSMSPTMPVGTIIVVKHIDFNDLQVGDVITYKTYSGDFNVTHRIHSINKNNQTVITKGDATTNLDEPVSASRIVGVVVAYFPQLGYVFDFIRNNIILITIGIILILFVLNFM